MITKTKTRGWSPCRAAAGVVLLLLTVLAVGCTDDAGSAGEAADDLVALTIQVNETSWQGEDISVLTRAGETIEGLKATYAKSWDFTTISDEDIALLEAASVLSDSYEEGTIDTWPEWNEKSTDYYYNKNAISGSVTVGGNELALTSGLSFSGVEGGGHFIIAPNRMIQMGGTNQVLTIPNLRAGQSVTIKFASASNSYSRTLTPSNLTGPSGFTDAVGTTTQEGKGTVTADGNVTFTSSSGAMNIYSIEVSRAKDEGFDVVGAALLGPTAGTKRYVLWNSTTGQWEPGETIYWKRTTTSETFSVFAYAPHISQSTPYTINTTTGVLTFPRTEDVATFATTANYVDLLYAGATVDKRDGLASFTFRHALAKMSFGTITNNTGAEVTLTDISIAPRSGSSFNTQANLNLTTGAWAALGTPSTSTTAIARNPASSLVIADKAIVSINQDPVLLIPNAPEAPATLGVVNVTVTLTFDTGNFSFDATLEQGKNKTYNITVEKNFEVVIE